MNRKLIIGILALTLFGCNRVNTPNDNISEMRFIAEHPSQLGTKASDTAFESGDKIGVYITEYDQDTPRILQIGGNYKNNIPVTFNGSSWSANPAIYWGEGKYDVYAYFPYLDPESVDELLFSVSLDQGSKNVYNHLDGYQASDFMFAKKKGVTSAEGDVKLTFSHKMSKLTVNLLKGEDFEGDIPESLSVYIHNTVTESLIDLSSGDVIKHPNKSAKTIKAKKVAEGKYEAIVVPQMLQYRLPLIEVVYDGVSYLVTRKFNFKSGTHHTVNITLTSNPEKVKIEIGGEIENGWL